MKDLNYSALLDLYGKALTDRQLKFMEQYYHLDYSLFEIAENESVSRQAVHACLKKAQGALDDLEEKLGFYARKATVRAVVAAAKMQGEPAALQEALDKIEEIL